MPTFHTGFPPYQPWISLRRRQTTGGITAGPGELDPTSGGQPVLFRGKNLLTSFCDAFRSMCGHGLSLDSFAEEMTTVEDVAELELRRASTVASISTEVNANEA
jgi:hypothetical protein